MDLLHIVMFIVGYGTFVFVLAETILKNESSTGNILKIVYVIPGIMAMFVLANGGHMIDQGWGDIVIYESTVNGTSNTTERVTVAAPVSPEMWGAWHLALGFLLLMYSIGHTLRLFWRRGA